MAETVVAVLNRAEDTEPLLDAGLRLLEIGGGGRLQALAVRTPPAATILPSEEVLTASREAAIRAEQEAWASGLHGRVQRWSVLPAHRTVQTEWLDVEGDAASVIAAHGRRADATVLARPSASAGERIRDALHAALFDTGSPVLIVPPRFHGAFARVVAIAWKDDGRADKAVRACLPTLRQADSVHVLRANHTPEMPAVLQEHAIAATLHAVPGADGPAAERILQEAHRVGADLLVMGGFAHGEWREALFGGVTRHMLAHADLPLFMRH